MCTDLLKRYIGAEMIPLVLIRDGQCLNALPGYAKIAENRIFLILGKVSTECGGRLFVIAYYISLSATHGHFVSRQNFIPLFREYRHPKSALNRSVISSL